MNNQRRTASLIRPFACKNGVPQWKRGLDLACVIIALPIVVPLMLAIAALIKVVSPGPVFFRQRRIGLNGRPFVIFKFRTMTVGAAVDRHREHLQQLMNSSAPMTKMDADGDERVFAVGRILRSSGLDELPQLINVVRGEMSWVGPRPCLPYEYENYHETHMGRFATLPGLTGLWQVCGKNRTTFEQMMAMDAKYAGCKTVWLDLVIMIKTPLVLMMQLMDVMRRRNGIRQTTKAGASVAEGDIRVLTGEQITVN